MSEKTYASIFVPKDLRQKIKLEAVKLGMTMIEFLEFKIYGKDNKEGNK